ncbi:MAG: hypothetical protein MMC33_004689 [Icmadophila ericetorum]|nr:hypothetical protein [Icmadophila ericetorum]
MADMPSGNRGGILVAVDAVLMSLAISAVGLRLLSRRLAGVELWWDDYLILLALPLVLGLDISNFIAVHFGFGKHISDLPSDATTIYLKIAYFDELMWSLSLGLIKYSILFFYRRIFPIPKLKITLFIIGGCVLAWQIGVLVSFILQCIPVEKAWNLGSEGHCSDPGHLFWGTSIPNIITDFVLLTLPMPLVWKLQLSMPQKIGLTATFLTGGFVSVVSLVRITVLSSVKPVDITYTYLPTAIWSLVELNIGILSACLPSMRILLRYITNPSNTPSNCYLSSSSRSRQRRTRSIGLGLSASSKTPAPNSEGGRGTTERKSNYNNRSSGFRARSHSETGSLSGLASSQRYEAHMREQQEIERFPRSMGRSENEMDTSTYNSTPKDDPKLAVAVSVSMSRISTDGLRQGAELSRISTDGFRQDRRMGDKESGDSGENRDRDRDGGRLMSPMTQEIPLNTILVTREVEWKREDRVLPAMMGARGLGRESPMLLRGVESNSQ